MDFSYGEREEGFRRELREWLAANLAEHRRVFPPSDDELTLHPDRSFDSSLAWHKRMHAGGWVGIHWPKEYGGRGASLIEQMIFTEELIAAGAPPGVNTIGLAMVGPAVIRHGTETQRQSWLRAILSADEIWCQGFSEPGAGSDLANLSTRAIEDGDSFVISGQKVWTSNAHRSHACILLALTDLAAPRHRGISCFRVDMQSPGITIRPLVQITGDAEFNEVFLDQVRVPKTNLVGAKNAGWKVAITILMYERMAVGSTVILHHYIQRLLALARRQPRDGGAAADPVLRQELAQIYLEGRLLRLTGLRYLTRQLRGEPPGPEGSVLKLALTDTYRKLAEAATRIVGPYHQLWKGTDRAPEGGRWAFQALFALRFGIAGGTTEIQKNIVGERMLGLPKG
ncbi:MAG: acyl-CoA dehydrogenase family protein [Candidatus Rokubacteria bacterium]|nr:acyl-CoA dehydrogenase family protein [Candidatus Rokubacteria bacterium]